MGDRSRGRGVGSPVVAREGQGTPPTPLRFRWNDDEVGRVQPTDASGSDQEPLTLVNNNHIRSGVESDLSPAFLI